MLSRFPNLGSKFESKVNFRKTLVGPYHVVLYKVFEDSIEIIRIFDGRQNPSKMQK